MKSLVVVKDQCKFHAVDSRETELQRFPLGWEQAHPPTEAVFFSLLEPMKERAKYWACETQRSGDAYCPPLIALPCS